ncbi:hypothetical protein ILYODFUR_027390 [Ilyodon furcidens]|uniref:Uncharacterized protein n=1 Tax=Ilyodon furcidens TaxID=33524 RepID=A0ABV0UMD2_9TELE
MQTPVVINEMSRDTQIVVITSRSPMITCESDIWRILQQALLRCSLVFVRLLWTLRFASLVNDNWTPPTPPESHPSVQHPQQYLQASQKSDSLCVSVRIMIID